MNRSGIRRSVAVATVLAVLTPAAASGADPAPTVEDVKRAWTARQEANKSFRVEWTETVKIKAGGYELPLQLGTPGPHPPNDSEFVAACSFATDGEKMASTDERAIYNLSRKNFDPSIHTATSDGKTSMWLNALIRPGWGAARIDKGEHSAGPMFHSGTNDPVLRVYRPLNGAFSAFDFKMYKLSDRTEKIRGAECVEIVLKDADKANYRFSLWCDPERGYLPVREKQRNANGGGYDLDWEYRKDDKGRWVPSRWTFSRVGRTMPITSTTKAEVKKLEFDPRFAAEAFAPKPPPSSHVTVYEDGQRKEQYLVRPDGSKRPLKPSERDKDYNELIKTNADGTPYVPQKK